MEKYIETDNKEYCDFVIVRFMCRNEITALD